VLPAPDSADFGRIEQSFVSVQPGRPGTLRLIAGARLSLSGINRHPDAREGRGSATGARADPRRRRSARSRRANVLDAALLEAEKRRRRQLTEARRTTAQAIATQLRVELRRVSTETTRR
jgi:hypothetical protein